MIKEGRPYLGVLYAGLILTADGPKVIEFNARFGDPETQIILPRLTSDFAQNITDILDGKEPNITWTDKGVTLGVVVASNGYPLDYEKVSSCQPRQKATSSPTMQGLSLRKMSRALLSNGGRVYMLVTTADTVKDAQNTIYSQLDKQNTEGLFTEQISEARRFDKGIRKATQSPNTIMVAVSVSELIEQSPFWKERLMTIQRSGKLRP